MGSGRGGGGGGPPGGHLLQAGSREEGEGGADGKAGGRALPMTIIEPLLDGHSLIRDACLHQDDWILHEALGDGADVVGGRGRSPHGRILCPQAISMFSHGNRQHAFRSQTRSRHQSVIMLQEQYLSLFSKCAACGDRQMWLVGRWKGGGGGGGVV